MINNLQATDTQALAKPLVWVFPEIFEEMLCILWKAKSVTLISRFRMLSQTQAVFSLRSCFFKILFNIAFPPLLSTSRRCLCLPGIP
jgi:hypothetical protein